MIALVIIFVVNSANNYSSERQLAAMMASSEEVDVTVFRGSTQPQIIMNDQLVVGDLYKFEVGMKFPADSVVVEANDAFSNECDLTGESEEF